MSAPRTAEDIQAELPPDRREVMDALLETLRTHLPEGFEETISYGMIGFVVPLSFYPAGYHTKRGEPLPFVSMAFQKHHVALYHMGLELFPDVLAWFRGEYGRQMTTKLDMGKGCIRFRNLKTIPYELIGQLCEKISPEDYVAAYERQIAARRKSSGKR